MAFAARLLQNDAREQLVDQIVFAGCGGESGRAAAASSLPLALADLVRPAEKQRRNDTRHVLEEQQDFLSHALPCMQAYKELKVKLADEVRQALEAELREEAQARIWIQQLLSLLRQQ
jgi:hypothetical protein